MIKGRCGSRTCPPSVNWIRRFSHITVCLRTWRNERVSSSSGPRSDDLVRVSEILQQSAWAINKEKFLHTSSGVASPDFRAQYGFSLTILHVGVPCHRSSRALIVRQTPPIGSKSQWKCWNCEKQTEEKRQ